MTIEQIAQVCHEANRGLCESTGDFSQPLWALAPQWQRESAIEGVKFHQSGEYGPSASHEKWMADKVAQGWVYGSLKLPELKQHPCLVPFDQLPIEQQKKDSLFAAIVKALS